MITQISRKSISARPIWFRPALSMAVPLLRGRQEYGWSVKARDQQGYGPLLKLSNRIFDLRILSDPRIIWVFSHNWRKLLSIKRFYCTMRWKMDKMCEKWPRKQGVEKTLVYLFIYSELTSIYSLAAMKISFCMDFTAWNFLHPVPKWFESTRSRKH